jgi:hypothetical protein
MTAELPVVPHLEDSMVAAASNVVVPMRWTPSSCPPARTVRSDNRRRQARERGRRSRGGRRRPRSRRTGTVPVASNGSHRGSHGRSGTGRTRPRTARRRPRPIRGPGTARRAGRRRQGEPENQRHGSGFRGRTAAPSGPGTWQSIPGHRHGTPLGDVTPPAARP